MSSSACTWSCCLPLQIFPGLSAVSHWVSFLPFFASFLPSCSLLLPLILSSLPCLLSFLHAQMDGSRSLTRCSTLGRRVSSLCLRVCLSLLIFLLSFCLVISAVLLTNRQMICSSPCAYSFYTRYLFKFYSHLFVGLLFTYMFFFFCSTHRHPRPFIHPIHSNIVFWHRQEFSIREYDTEETILCFFTCGGLWLVNPCI